MKSKKAILCKSCKGKKIKGSSTLVIYDKI